MGNLQVSAHKRNCIRVVHANGKVQELHTSVVAAELVAHSPNFLICHSSSLQAGKRPCPLQPDTELKLGHLYFVLPFRVFQCRLAWSHVSSLAESATSPRRMGAKSSVRLPSFKICHIFRNEITLFRLIQKENTVQIKALKDLHKIRAEELLESVPGLPRVNVCDTPDQQIRYIDQLISRSNSWRPRLATIAEFRAAEGLAW